MPPPRWPLLLLLGGCRLLEGGVPAPAVPPDEPDAGPFDAAARPERADGAPGRDSGAVPPDPVEPPAVPGPPEEVGCADGTREGFTDVESWRDIAGCAGAWQIPGLVAAEARTPRCDRRAGNTGLDPSGEGCSVADLCAPGWHVCRSGDEVERRSPSDCEGAAPAGARQFFLVLAAASPQGVCYADPAATNDLHGCGSFGQPGSVGCHPLDRRLGFADCLATAGVWQCGGPDDHLREAALVVKTAPALGGALCCRDP